MSAPGLEYLDRQARSRLQTRYHEIFFQHPFSSERHNHTPEDGGKNWQILESFQAGLKKLSLDWLQLGKHQTGFSGAGECFAWLFLNMRLMQHFPPRFFRQSEALFFLMSLTAEKMKLLALLEENLRGENLKPELRIRQLPAEACLSLYAGESSLSWLILLLQHLHLENGIFEFLFESFPAEDSEEIGRAHV